MSNNEKLNLYTSVLSNHVLRQLPGLEPELPNEHVKVVKLATKWTDNGDDLPNEMEIMKFLANKISEEIQMIINEETYARIGFCSLTSTGMMINLTSLQPEMGFMLRFNAYPKSIVTPDFLTRNDELSMTHRGVKFIASQAAIEDVYACHGIDLIKSVKKSIEMMLRMQDVEWADFRVTAHIEYLDPKSYETGSRIVVKKVIE